MQDPAKIAESQIGGRKPALEDIQEQAAGSHVVASDPAGSWLVSTLPRFRAKSRCEPQSWLSVLLASYIWFVWRLLPGSTKDLGAEKKDEKARNFCMVWYYQVNAEWP